MADPQRILIIDDEKDVRDSCARILGKAGLHVDTAWNGTSGLSLIERNQYDLIFLDLIMPGSDGLTLLKHIKAIYLETPVIVISAYGTVKTAVEAMKLGAYDFLPKSFTPKELRQIVMTALEEKEQTREQIYRLDQQEQAKYPAQIVYKSEVMSRVMEKVERVAPTDSTVLITGESGTGKGLIASLIHQMSPRKTRKFVSVDCGTLVETLFESELFGHVKGAFTGAGVDKVGKFELAQHGTIFFDEISNINLEVQAKLLKAVEEREISRVGSHRLIRVDVRILAATNQDLYKAIENGQLREDLYYRLNVVSIHLPPLRERREDIPQLIDFFFDMYSQRRQAEVKSISAEAKKLLMAHDWPGNVRELANTIERLVVLGRHGVIEPEDLTFAEWRTSRESTKVGLTLDDVEREHIIKVLERFQGRRTEAARALGIDRSTLREKIKRYGLE
ncbi:MAG: sigma-54-dependent Fis family transcriptional regulator [Deltaproteobacteria bacterium]|nr:sigma-54-dependent Fis family transcriptional regulator [Deltaproteobacteria bacterium]